MMASMKQSPSRQSPSHIGRNTVANSKKVKEVENYEDLGEVIIDGMMKATMEALTKAEKARTKDESPTNRKT